MRVVEYTVGEWGSYGETAGTITHDLLRSEDLGESKCGSCVNLEGCTLGSVNEDVSSHPSSGFGGS